MNFPAKFETPEVAELFEQVRHWCHPEHPFLDPNYSPGGYYPVIDFTPYISAWLQQEKYKPIAEIWNHLTPTCDATEFLFGNLLLTICPEELEFDKPTCCELLAVNFLTHRANFCGSRFVADAGALLIATRLASIQWIPPLKTRPYLYRQAVIEAFVLDGAEMHKRKCALADSALVDVKNPVSENILRVGAWLLQIPPTTRLVLYYFIKSLGHSKKLRTALFYDDRCYGCRPEWNLHFLNWMGCFDEFSDSDEIPTSITKDHLLNALNQRGIKIKKGAKKDEIIAITREQEGLVSSLLCQFAPDYRRLKSEWMEPLIAWTNRVDRLRCLASAIFCFVASNTPGGPSIKLSTSSL